MADGTGIKKYFGLILKVSISAVLLIFLFRRIDFQKSLFYIRTVNVAYFIYALTLFLIILFLGLLRWNILLKTLKHDLSFGRIFVSFCGGLFFNTFLPSSIGGDIARAVDLSLHTKDASSIMATVFLDRLFGFVGLVLVAFFGFFLSYRYGITEDTKLLLIILMMTLLLCAIFLVLFSKRAFLLFHTVIPFKFLKDFLEKFHQSCYVFRFQKKALAQTFVLSVLIQGGFSFVMYFIGMSLGISAHIVYYLVFIPIVSSISILPISIGGLGVRDNAAVVLFSRIGVAADRVVAMTLLSFAFLLFVGLIGGGIYGFALYSRRIQRDTKDALSGS
mgnify:CR=1 FL=1